MVRAIPTASKRGHEVSSSPNEEQVPTEPGRPDSDSEEVADPSPTATVSGGGEPSAGLSEVHSASDANIDMAPAELKANELSSVEDLIRFAYQHVGKRLNLTSAVVRRIAEGARLEDNATEPLFTLVGELLDRDPLLAVPPRVLAFAASAKPAIHLRRRLEAAMAMALRRHVMFGDRRLTGALEKPPDDVDSVFDGLREVANRMTPERLGVEADALRPTHRKRLHVNATVSLTLLLALRDGWTADAVADVLYRRLWRDSADVTDRLAAIGAMSDARDAAALAALGRVFDRQRRDAERLAHDAQGEAQQALQRALAADAELANRDERIRRLEQQSADLAREVETLNKSLAAEERNRVHDRSHHVDDYEALRTRIVRVLDKQIDLLSDGLHALRNGATDVADEFTDRTIAALSRELAQLRAQGGDE